MGAGNWLPCKLNELKDWKGYYVDYAAVYGDRYYTDQVYDVGEVDEFIEDLVYDVKESIPELKEIEEFRGDYELAYLEDGPIQMVIGENETSAAVYFILKDGYEYDDMLENNIDRIQDYASVLKDILIGKYPGYVSERTSAWTSEIVG